MTYSDTPQGRVLLADDEEAFRAGAAELLRIEGFRCDAVADAQEAAERLQNASYDLLIADVCMPGNYDLELLDQAAELAPGMPVVLLSGFPSPESAVKSVATPTVAYLAKPFDFDDLLRQVRNWAVYGRVSCTVRESRARVQQWCERAESLEVLLRRPAQDQVVDVVRRHSALTLRLITESLDDLSRLLGYLVLDRDDDEQARLAAALELDAVHEVFQEMIGVLEATKGQFRSKNLGRLRRKLEAALERNRQFDTDNP